MLYQSTIGAGDAVYSQRKARYLQQSSQLANTNMERVGVETEDSSEIFRRHHRVLDQRSYHPQWTVWPTEEPLTLPINQGVIGTNGKWTKGPRIKGDMAFHRTRDARSTLSSTVTLT